MQADTGARTPIGDSGNFLHTIQGEFQPQRENNDINSGHNFYLAGLLLGKHTHSACTKIVSEPILCLYNMKMMNTDQ